MGRSQLLITGSSGLIGSEVCVFFAVGFTIHGVDNNHRAVFFGPEGDTSWNRSVSGRASRVSSITSWISAIAQACWPGEADPSRVIVHTAAQPSTTARPPFPSMISTSTPSAR